MPPPPPSNPHLFKVNQSDPFASPKLHQLLSGLSLGSYRYPGGSIGNYWDWKRDTLSPQANSEYYQTIANLSAKFFPPHAFGFAKFDKMLVQASPHGNTASNILTLDVSTAGPDASVPAMVVEALGLSRANKFEIGNEVYDPRQGPPPNGYRTVRVICACVHAHARVVNRSLFLFLKKNQRSLQCALRKKKKTPNCLSLLYVLYVLQYINILTRQMLPIHHPDLHVHYTFGALEKTGPGVFGKHCQPCSCSTSYRGTSWCHSCTVSLFLASVWQMLGWLEWAVRSAIPFIASRGSLHTNIELCGHC